MNCSGCHSSWSEHFTARSVTVASLAWDREQKCSTVHPEDFEIIHTSNHLADHTVTNGATQHRQDSSRRMEKKAVETFSRKIRLKTKKKEFVIHFRCRKLPGSRKSSTALRIRSDRIGLGAPERVLPRIW
jgi:hypothetical protein